MGSLKDIDVPQSSLNGAVLSEVKVGDAFQNVEFDPRFSHFKAANKKNTDLVWKNISLKIGEKQILKGVSGHVVGGEVCALMGASGAGKSSLMNVLAGRVVPGSNKTIGGDVLVNGRKINPLKYRRKIAYVMQEDLLYATATARESLEFSARLRLEKDIAFDSEKIKKIVDGLLESLGLTSVQHTMVGSAMVRGLSGGEKKRVAIGVELVTNPSLLFLDEPTSGLDSFSAWKVVKILQSLGDATGCSILCTIHQPSSEIFNSFHKTIVLCRGSVMYNGSVGDMPQIFNALKKPIPPLTNPADYVILLAQTIANDDELPKFNVDDPSDTEKMAKLGVKIEGEHLLKEKSDSTTSSDAEKHLNKPGMFTQAFYLCLREFRNLRRDLGFLAVTMGIRIFMNLLFGCVFFQGADRDQEDFAVGNAFGTLIMVLMSAMFGSAQGPLLTFPLERGIMLREYQTGTYSSFPYLLAKLMVELPLIFVASLAAEVAFYFLIGFHGNFGLLTLVLWMIGLASASYAMTLGAAVSDAKKGQEFAPLILVPQLLFTGIFIPIKSIPVWLRWAQYLCVLKYGVNLALFVEFGDCTPEGIPPERADAFVAQCEALLEKNDADRDKIWLYVLIMIAIFVVFRGLSLSILVFRARHFTG